VLDSVSIISKNHIRKRRVEMKAFSPERFLLILLLALLLISCSGSGASSNSGGIGGSGMTSQGSVSGYGSIIVNGTEFDTTNARIIVEGQEIGIGDAFVLNNLEVGMVVTVYGTDSNNPVADRVTYNDNVEGPVESINIDPTNPNKKDLVVLGQTVFVNVVTEFEGVGFTFDTIAVNDVVEVSGFVDDNDDIWATFIEKTDDFTPSIPFDVEVTGIVQNLTATTFDINGLIVDYTIVLDLPPGFEEGMLVEVEGTLDDFANPMIATSIEEADELDVENENEIEITGFVTDTLAPDEFIVGNLVVRTDANTEYADGDQAKIALGQKLEAEGTLRNGVLYAWEVEFWEPDEIEVEGEVTDATLAPGQFTLDYTQVVQTDPVDTIFEPSDLIITEGINLEVKGIPVGILPSDIMANKVSLEED